jgi:hypothetical protein
LITGDAAFRGSRLNAYIERVDDVVRALFSVRSPADDAAI